MTRIIVVIPHSHTWFWTQTCVASLLRNPPSLFGAGDCDVVIVNNSPWSPAIKGILCTNLSSNRDQKIHVVDNYKSNKFHASALDCIVEKFDFDYLMTLETDVLALRPTWLRWFFDQMKPTDYAVGMWHHENFINPSCTLYRGSVLREMMGWCKSYPEPTLLRWGPQFSLSQEISLRQPERDYQDWYDDNISWIAGPFADKRGWPQGTVLKEEPSGQLKGPGWYEPGQMLHHWAVQAGYTYTVCPSVTLQRSDNLPLQTMYGPHESISWDSPLEAKDMFGKAESVHLWGGTRALDIIKHEVTCQFVKGNTPFWLAREARFWKQVVPEDVQEQTLDLIREFGWHITGQGRDHINDRDRAAADFVRECYRAGGIVW